jgi:parallel beta-helix repeat protein
MNRPATFRRPDPARTIALLALLLLSSPGADAETQNCTEITALPATITSQGVYCLKQDLSTAITLGPALQIQASNVILDCNDHKLGGLAAGPGTQARGIFSSSFPTVRANLTVRRCHVRGFHTGIQLHGSGHVIEDNRLDGNTAIGIAVSGDDGVIRRNRVSATGGNTLGDAPIGIEATLDVEVLDNTVAQVFASAASNDTATGIYTNADQFGIVRGNRVRGVVGDGSGSRWGIFAFGAGRLLLSGNHVVNSGSGGSAITCNQTDDAIAAG